MIHKCWLLSISSYRLKGTAITKLYVAEVRDLDFMFTQQSCAVLLHNVDTGLCVYEKKDCFYCLH